MIDLTALESYWMCVMAKGEERDSMDLVLVTGGMEAPITEMESAP